MPYALRDCAHVVSSTPGAAGPAPTGQRTASGGPQWSHSARGLALPGGKGHPVSRCSRGTEHRREACPCHSHRPTSCMGTDSASLHFPVQRRGEGS